MKTKTLLPDQKNRALIIMKLKGWSLERSFRWVEKNDSLYQKYVRKKASSGVKLTRKRYKEKYAHKELIFRGFVPLKSYKKNPDSNYIQTNTTVKGEYLIYPQPFTNTADGLKNGEPYIWNYFPYIGIEGYTRIDTRAF